MDEGTYARVRDRLNDAPVPESFIVSGRLEDINYSNGRFQLLVSQDSYLPGRLRAESLSVEALRPLWGKQITVEGTVHFRSNGQVRLIAVHRIGSRLEKDSVFEEMPSVKFQEPDILFPDSMDQVRAFDPIELAGAWPGDEPIEDLLDQLD